METLPTFFYNPNAYALGLIKAQPITCQCCGQARSHAYQGNLYCQAEVRALCPWCIADGSAAEKFEGSFVSIFESELDDAPALSEASVAAVSCRTPGYLSWQDSVWLGHCGEACVFVGYVGSKELRPVWQQVLPDVLASGIDEEIIREEMLKDGDLTGYLFQCQHCGHHRLHVDAN